jgi:hypothetical protein
MKEPFFTSIDPHFQLEKMYYIRYLQSKKGIKAKLCVDFRFYAMMEIIIASC